LNELLYIIGFFEINNLLLVAIKSLIIWLSNFSTRVITVININFCRCDGGDKGKKCRDLIDNACKTFFKIGIKRIENICNNKRINFIEEWQNKNEKDSMREFDLSISYIDGIKEISPSYTLIEPEEINIHIIEGKTSKVNNGQAAMEICPLDKDFKKWLLNVYLDVMDYSNDNLRWKGFEESIPEIVYHELLHACGDHPWNNKHDGILRHNIIGITSVKEAEID